MLRLWVIYTLQSLGRSETPTQMSEKETPGSPGEENLGMGITIDMCLGSQTIPIKSEYQIKYEDFKDHRLVVLKIWDLWTTSSDFVHNILNEVH